MKNKLFVGLAVLALLAIYPRSSLSSNETAKSDNITLSGDSTLILNGEVDGENVANLIAKAREMDQKLSGLKEKLSSKKHIRLFMNTPGGNIQLGLELIEVLQGLGRPVDTVTLFSASMGFQIVQNLGDRLILKNGILMSHHAAGEINGQFGGQPTQMDNRYKLWLDRVRELDEQTVKRTNGKQTLESYTKEYDHEMWPTGTRSVQEGYADRIVTVKCDSSMNGATTHHLNFFGMDISYDIDNCPLNTTPMNIKVNAPDGKTMTQEKVDEVKTKFLTQFESKQRQVIPMYW